MICSRSRRCRQVSLFLREQFVISQQCFSVFFSACVVIIAALAAVTALFSRIGCGAVWADIAVLAAVLSVPVNWSLGGIAILVLIANCQLLLDFHHLLCH